MVDACPRPIKRITRDANLLRDLIRRREADPINVFRQHVRIAPHFLDRLLPVGLEDSHRSACAYTMAVQEQHDFSYLFCFPPRLLNSLPAFRSDPIDQAAAEVTLDAFDRRRRHGFHQSGLELESVLFVSNPPALGLQPLACGYGGQRSDDRHLIAVTSDSYPKHTEAVFVVVESD